MARRRKLTREERLENIQKAAQLLEDTAGHRNLMLVAAHQDGIPLREIAKAAGLSHQRVHQIVRD